MALRPQNLSEEEIARLARDAKPIEAAALAYASTLQIQQAGNDAVLTFARPRPALLASGEPAPFMMNEITAIVYVSMGTLKDFSLIVSDTVRKYEEVNGEIETDYTRRTAKS